MRLYEKQKEKGVSEEHLDDIAAYALRTQKFRLKQIKALLALPPKEEETDATLNLLSAHENIRGSSYYD